MTGTNDRAANFAHGTRWLCHVADEVWHPPYSMLAGASDILADIENTAAVVWRALCLCEI